MATKKISELTSAAGIDGTELVPIVKDGTTVQATVADLTATSIPFVRTSRIVLSGNQEVGGTETLLQFNTVQFDSGSDWNTSTYRFQPKVAGYYFVNLSVDMLGAASPNTVRAYIKKNGTTHTFLRETTDIGYKQTSGSAIIYLNGTTDYLDFAADGNSTASTISGSYDRTFVETALLGSGIVGNSTDAGARATIARASVNQNIALTTWTKAQYDTVEDTGGDWDATNYQFKPKVAGFYQITSYAAFQTGGAGDGGYVAIAKNTSDYIAISNNMLTNNAGWRYVSTSTLVYMNGTTDYIETHLYSAGDTAIVNNARMTAHFVGQAQGDSEWQTPTLGTNWTTFSGSSGDEYKPRYRKDSAGNVHLQGIVESTVANNANVTFTLPVGYRPNHYIMGWQPTGNPNVPQRISITPTGEVILSSIQAEEIKSITANQWVGIDITFMAEQ